MDESPSPIHRLNVAGRDGETSMTDHEIKVVPVDGGWSVQCRLAGAPQMFLSGARAEESARRLAERVAASGADARVVVHDRSHALVGAQRYFGSEG
jgi:hypothetical protein